MQAAGTNVRTGGNGKSLHSAPDLSGFVLRTGALKARPYRQSEGRAYRFASTGPLLFATNAIAPHIVAGALIFAGARVTR